MAASGTELQLLEQLAPERVSVDVKTARREVAGALLAAARGEDLLEAPESAGELAAAFLRGYDNRRSTQEAYARDLADWFVWLSHAGIDGLDAGLSTIESYMREPLPIGKPPAPATLARRLACLSHYYRRAHYEGLIERNPVEFATRPKVPEQAETAGVSKQRARRLIAAARAEGPRETLLVLLLLELGLRVSEAVGADIEDLSEQGPIVCCDSRARARARRRPSRR